MVETNNLDIVSLIQNNPICRLNSAHNQKFVERVQNSFNDNEQQLFLASFYTYLNYDKENDFVIELNKVWKWLGFGRIEECKRVLVKHFIKNSDYKIVFRQSTENIKENFAPPTCGAKKEDSYAPEVIGEKKETRGGHNKETILLNVKTFKKLCLKSNTKRADSIHDYFIRLEEVLHDLLLEEAKDLQHQLSQKQNLIETQEKELATLKRLKTKKWYKQEPGDVIYAIKVILNIDGQDRVIIKIGKTKNVKKRESYYAENQTGDMFYIKRCFNCDLTEKVIHHILDKHREENNKEWFDISSELATYTIDIVCNFLDNFIDSSENLPSSNLREYIDMSYKSISSDEQPQTDAFTDKLNKVINIESNKDKFKRFIEEFCEKGDNYSVLSYELFGAYRIWARGATNTDRSEFLKFIKENYESKRKYYKEHDASLLTYFGIKPKDLTPLPTSPEDLPKYEEFILTQCKFNYNYRMGYTVFIDTYKEWCSKKYPHTVERLSKQEQFNMDAYINRYFLKEKINIPGFRNVVGIWGLQLKSDNTIKVGRIPVLKKEIVKIDYDTKRIIEEYDGMEKATKILKLSSCTIRKYLRNKKLLDNKFILEYKKNLPLPTPSVDDKV